LTGDLDLIPSVTWLPRTTTRCDRTRPLYNWTTTPAPQGGPSQGHTIARGVFTTIELCTRRCLRLGGRWKVRSTRCPEFYGIRVHDGRP